jgi:hypothetical protein
MGICPPPLTSFYISIEREKRRIENSQKFACLSEEADLWELK